MVNKDCEYCGSNEHYKTWCFKRPKNVIKVRVPLPKQSKPINKKGKHYYAWQSFRKQWLATHHDTYFTCGICGNPVSREEVTLDHIIPRSFSPELRYDEKNIQPAHYLCNTTKGSKKNVDYIRREFFS